VGRKKKNLARPCSLIFRTGEPDNEEKRRWGQAAIRKHGNNWLLYKEKPEKRDVPFVKNLLTSGKSAPTYHRSGAKIKKRQRRRGDTGKQRGRPAKARSRPIGKSKMGRRGGFRTKPYRLGPLRARGGKEITSRSAATQNARGKHQQIEERAGVPFRNCGREES